MLLGRRGRNDFLAGGPKFEVTPLLYKSTFYLLLEQEAQLPQRNSASAAHMEGARHSSPLSLPGYSYAYGRIRNPQQTHVKRAVH